MSLPKDFRWKELRTLGEGGQARVIEVEDTTGSMSGKYALKPLKKNASPQAYERFYREITAIKALDHPGVIRIVDHSERKDEFHYYVMELFTDVTTLKKLLHDPQNPYFDNPYEAVSLFSQLVSVVEAVSRVGVVHRDLSPANVLILPDRKIKVIDFGICQIENLTTITLVDEGVGTKNYMAPECEAGAERDISFRSDLYSAGKILWSAVTNQFAFAREKPVFREKSMSMLSENEQTFHLHHIFERTIRHDPANRFNSVAAALEMCERVSIAIARKATPLERILLRCPQCSFGHLVNPLGYPAITSHPFRNSLPDGMHPMQCDYCGYFQVQNQQQIVGKLEARKGLD